MIFYNFKSHQSGINTKKRTVNTQLLISMLLLLVFSPLILAEGGGRYYTTDAWSFGVQADTQWTLAENTENPNFVAASILKQVNDEFIEQGVKLVFALGDMSDRAKPGAMATRKEFTQPLYDAGIGFFPMRGNHEAFGWVFNYGSPDMESKAMLENFPQTRKEMFGISNLSSPATLDGKENDDLNGLSYSFDYGPKNSNVRFVILDTEDVECETTEMTRNGVTNPYWPKECISYPIPSQQEWISERFNIKNRNTTHAIVMAHRAPINQNHIDSPFNPNTILGQKPYGLDHNPEAQNEFFESMYENEVKLYLGAHDHIHHRSIIKSPDGKSQLQEIIAAGLSTKFYEPAPIPNPQKDRQGNVTIEDQWYGQKKREMPLSQEQKNIGYYIYTVDGPRMTVEYYSDSKGNFESNNKYPYGANNPDFPAGVTPKLNFEKKETFGYSINGKEFMIAQGESYTVVQDSFEKTTMKILSGFNNSTAVDGNNRKLIKSVETGWVKNSGHDKLKNSIFSIWGMSELGKEGQTDVYVLSISCDTKNIKSLKKGETAIATFVNGKWVNAVDENFGGKKKFVVGKYKSKYGLGTYGIDPKTKTAWAVLNYNADFTITKFAETEQ